jgi:hypothetical protein
LILTWNNVPENKEQVFCPSREKAATERFKVAFSPTYTVCALAPIQGGPNIDGVAKDFLLNA